MTPFDKLSSDEKQCLLDAIPYITVLIAGADGKIDANETEWATKLTKIRSYSFHESLQSYYEAVGKKFSDKLVLFTGKLPEDVAARTTAIGGELRKLNSVLAKLNVADNEYAFHMYSGFLSFAKHVAESSGGFFRFGSISKEEEALLGLDMINKIELIEKE